MDKKIKIILMIAVLSLPFWWGINVFQKGLENAIYIEEITKNPPGFFIAEIAQNYSLSQISAESAISLKIEENANEVVLYRKNEEKEMPIASLSKLMTAIIASEFYKPETEIVISPQAVSQSEEIGQLKIGEKLSVENLLYIMLIESSNDAAFSLAEQVGERAFTALMNVKSNQLGMNNTFFFDPTGLDNETSSQSQNETNFSSAIDLVKLAKYILKKPLLLEITSKKEFSLYLENGTPHHLLKNTNELLERFPEIISGKTGYTEKAGGCLFIILKCEKSKGYLINIVLNSKERFKDMEQLIKYANSKRQCN